MWGAGKALLAWGWGSSASGEGAEAPLPLRLGVSLGRRVHEGLWSLEGGSVPAWAVVWGL